MLAAQGAVIAPHLPRLTPWVIGCCVACGVWRVMVFRGRWAYPGRWTKAALVIGGLIAVPVSYSKLYGLEPAVALLIVAFTLKLLEMQKQRDAFIVIVMAYFVGVTEFLFDQGIPMTLYIMVVMVMITAALVGLNQTVSHGNPLRTARIAGTLLLQALPMMLVLFVLFPRIAPLWTVPLQTQTGRTGVSDSMTPGDIARLTQSDALAFRATFKGRAPPTNQLYWRGLVLSRFDGRTWTHENQRVYFRDGPPVEYAGRMNAPWDGLIERQDDPSDYSVMLEPTNQRWVFALATPVPVSDNIGLVRDYRLMANNPVGARLRYEVRSFLDYRVERELSPFWRHRTTLLPPDGNTRSRDLAKSMRLSAGSVAAYVADVLKMFNQQEFVYTLKPPILGNDAIDEFLLASRRGFCEHFAGSFVFMMRAADVPARVVVGYQGGEYNPVGNYVAVRQFDAHAWAEVWLAGRGWVRVDPTSAVAPERIEDGLEAAVDEGFLEGSPLSLLHYQTLWITDLRLQLSALGHYWDSWVVGYNPSMQVSLLSRFIEDVSVTKLGAMMLAAVFAVIGALAVYLLLTSRRQKLAPVDEAYLAFCAVLARRGLERQAGEGPMDYAVRIGIGNPDIRDLVDAVTQIYVGSAYATETPSTEQLKDLRRAIRSLRSHIATSNV